MSDDKGQAAHGFKGQVRRLVRVLRFVRPHAGGKAGVAFGMLVLAGLTEGISILLLIPVLASLVPGDTSIVVGSSSFLSQLDFLGEFRLDLEAALIFVVLAVAAQAALSRASNIMIIDATVTAAHGMRAQLFEVVGYARWQTLMTGRHADISHALTMDVDRIQYVMNSFLIISQALIMLALYTVLSVLVSPLMTLTTVAVGIVFLFLLHPIRKYASAYGESLSLQRQAQYRTLGEFLGGLKVVKSLNAEHRYIEAYSENSRVLTEGMKKLTRVSSLPHYFFQLGSAVGAAGFVYLAVSIADMPIEQIVVMLFLFMRIAPRFTTLQTQYQRLIVDVAGYDNIQRVFETYSHSQDRPGQTPRERLKLQDNLRFKNVTFKYASGAEPALASANFDIPARQITALIGASGSGKTTAADLILSLLEPTEGRIEVDGRVLNSSERRAWRECIAYVPQEVYLTNNSVRANLSFAAPDATEADMWVALRQAQAADLVRDLVDGLDTPLGEGGGRFSGGEKQRIALARALLRKPDVLILDEATSALDWQNQALIAEAIKSLRGQMTVVTIAHRPSMIAFADFVIAFEDGRVTETGPFADFARREGSQLSNMLAGEAGTVASPASQATS